MFLLQLNRTHEEQLFQIHRMVWKNGFPWSCLPSDVEWFIYVGDGNKVAADAIGTFRLLWKTGLHLDLVETFVAPSLRQTLISSFGQIWLCILVHLEMVKLVCRIFLLKSPKLHKVWAWLNKWGQSSPYKPVELGSSEILRNLKKGTKLILSERERTKNIF